MPCALSAERKKRAHTPVEDKQSSQRYDISIIAAQDMNCSVILMVKGALHSGTVGAERHVLHIVNCLAAGIPRSAPFPQTRHSTTPPCPPPRPLSHLLALICRHSPLLQAHHRAAEWNGTQSSAPPQASSMSSSPSLQCQHPHSTLSQVSGEVVYRLLLTQPKTFRI